MHTGTDSDQHGNMFVTLDGDANNDSGDEGTANNANGAPNSQIELEIQVGEDDEDDEDVAFRNIITENQGNDSQMEDDLGAGKVFYLTLGVLPYLVCFTLIEVFYFTWGVF